MKSKNQSTVVGVFSDRGAAEKAVHDLKQAGFRDNQISLVARSSDGEIHTEGSHAAAGAATGVAAGAGVMALTSLGISFGVIPVIGPILAVGPLAAALISAVGGAAAGGLVGGLIGFGIPKEEAEYYHGELHSGRTLVTVHAEGRRDEAWAILHRNDAYNYQTGSVQKGTGTAAQAARSEGEQILQVHEEELHARKTPVRKGEVRVHKEIITEQKTINVPVQREEVVIERHPVSGKASSTDLRAGEEIRIPVMEEKVRVEKEAVVKEEVRVGKRTIQETKQVSGTVRKEEVKVEQEGDVEVTGSGTKKKRK